MAWRVSRPNPPMASGMESRSTSLWSSQVAPFCGDLLGKIEIGADGEHHGRPWIAGLTEASDFDDSPNGRSMFEGLDTSKAHVVRASRRSRRSGRRPRQSVRHAIHARPVVP
jgi:hypothetical protein